MFDPKNATLICPKNDLESVTILKIAKNYFADSDIIASEQAWGARLGEEPRETFENLKKYVVIVEMPDEEVERELEKEGHRVIIIDHHRYENGGRVLDRFNPLSSLEQFARRVGHTLDEDEKLIAANDTGKIFELARKGKISKSDLEKIRAEEQAILGYDEKILKQSQKDYDGQETGINFSNFKMVLTTLDKVMRIADLHHFALLDALKAKGGKYDDIPKHLKNILILTTDEARTKVSAVHFFGEDSYRADFEALGKQFGGEGADIAAWKGGNAGVSFFWGAKAQNPDSTADQAADAALDVLLGPDRPLLKFSTVFFYPFSYKKRLAGEDTTKTEDTNKPKLFCPAPHWEMTRFNYVANSEKYQEYIYFHSCVRDVLFPDTSQPDARTELICHHFVLENRIVREGRLEVVYGQKDDENTMGYPITHLAIHSLMDEVGVLLFQVTEEIEKEIQDFKYLWLQCLKIEKFREKHLTVRDTLYFNEIARKIYPSFPQQAKEGKIPKRISFRFMDGPPLTHDFTQSAFPPGMGKNKALQVGYEPEKSEIINHFVETFLGHRNFCTILDDRMLIHTFASIAGNGPADQKAIERDKILFSHYMYVDHYGAGWEYDEAFTRKILKESVYYRWRHYGLLSGFTRFSGAYYGRGWFFNNVAFQHFDTMYFQMALLAIFYRAFLLSFSKEISDTTRKLAQASNEQEHRNNFLDLKEKFMKFTNIYWFPEITNQDQGIELFDLYKNSFDFEKMYDEVKEEVDRADAYLDTKDQINLNRLSRKIGIGGFCLGTLAIIVSLFALDYNFSSYLSISSYGVVAVLWLVILHYVIHDHLPLNAETLLHITDNRLKKTKKH